MSKSERYFYDTQAIAEPSVSNHPSGNGSGKGEPRLISSLASGIESLESLIQAPQNVLAAGEVGQLNQAIRTHLFKLAGLVIIVQGDAPVLPGTAPFFKSGVIQFARSAQLPSEKVCLLPGRIQAVFEGKVQLSRIIQQIFWLSQGGAAIPLPSKTGSSIAA